MHNAEREKENSPWKNCFLKNKDSSKLHYTVFPLYSAPFLTIVDDLFVLLLYE